MVRTLANGSANMANVQNGCETDVDIHGNHFTRHQPTCFLSQFTAVLQTVYGSKRLRGRKKRKAFAETLNAPAFLVNGHHQAIARGFADLAYQFTQLLGVVIVAGKQNQPTDQRVFQNFALFGIQLKACHI
ncbi:hypothetical protein D3C75_425070 [compost metagenome]